MTYNDPIFYHLGYFSVVGTNFTKADTQVRGQFAIGNESVKEFYSRIKRLGISDSFIISTCNRTEFYGCAPENVLKKEVMNQLDIAEKAFDEYFYIKTGVDAVRHFFRVTSGLDSQIIGDYEIVGQVKKAIQFSREGGMIGTLTDRISNFAFQASKEVKTRTNLSSGKYSVSYAAAELIQTESEGIEPKRILIIGTGEIGKAMAKNLREYFPTCQLTLTNRTRAHAEELALQVNASVLPFEEIIKHLHEFDAIITAANSDKFLIESSQASYLSKAFFLDLSIPQVIDPKIKQKSNIKLFSVDEISSFHNELIKQRHLEVPKAELILEEFIHKLMEWQNVFFHREIIQSYKIRMENFQSLQGQSKRIDKTFSKLIQLIKAEGYRGCSVIQTMNELIAAE
jgi:glutamyl-tRNA reductase